MSTELYSTFYLYAPRIEPSLNRSQARSRPYAARFLVGLCKVVAPERVAGLKQIEGCKRTETLVIGGRGKRCAQSGGHGSMSIQNWETFMRSEELICCVGSSNESSHSMRLQADSFANCGRVNNQFSPHPSLPALYPALPPGHPGMLKSDSSKSICIFPFSLDLLRYFSAGSLLQYRYGFPVRHVKEESAT